MVDTEALRTALREWGYDSLFRVNPGIGNRWALVVPQVTPLDQFTHRTDLESHANILQDALKRRGYRVNRSQGFILTVS